MMEALFSQDQVYEMRERIATKEAEARGEKKGIGIGEKKGEAKSFWKLVRDEIITKATAAKELGISIAQFDKLCKEYAFA